MWVLSLILMQGNRTLGWLDLRDGWEPFTPHKEDHSVQHQAFIGKVAEGTNRKLLVDVFVYRVYPYYCKGLCREDLCLFRSSTYQHIP